MYKRNATSIQSYKPLLSSPILPFPPEKMAAPKTIPAALVVFLCFCSQAQAIKDFDYYSLVLMVIFLPTLHCHSCCVKYFWVTLGQKAKPIGKIWFRNHNHFNINFSIPFYTIIITAIAASSIV